MNNQKIENQLNLALDSTNEEREKSNELSVGYDEEEREWELIIRYSGELDEIRNISVNVIPLLGSYAIIRIRESRIDELAMLREVEYIEKPKSLYFQIVNGKRVSCISSVQQETEGLYGRGTLIGVIDSGIDFSLNEFKNPDGTTKIRNIWDQTLTPIEGEQTPSGYDLGVEYDEEQINEEAGIRTRDFSGHGTAVAAIAAGVAPESQLIIVKMGNPRRNGFPRTTEMMLGIDYVIRKGIEYQMPVAINLSIGNTYGSHRGDSLVEQFIDIASAYGRTVICVGSGNEGTTAGHVQGTLVEDEEEIIELAVQENAPTLNLQIWKSYVDEVEITLETPTGERVGRIRPELGPQQITLDGTKLLIYYGEPSPYSVRQEIYIDFLPEEQYIESGVWKIILMPGRIVDGIFEMWLPSQSSLNVGTAFLYPNAQATLTIPSTASKVITVAAYDARTLTYANFSGRGIAEGKPDIAAPGVDVITARVGGGYQSVTGTSFATPFVTGSAALLMEWGIVRGNDPFLYGEKVKAYLRSGAKELPGFTRYPNEQIGYGALCVKESIPR